MIVVELTIFFIVLIVLGTFALAGYKGAPWVPTKKVERARLLELISLHPGDRVYDLGCGNGAVLFDLSDKFPSVIAQGVELSVLPYMLGKLKLWRHHKRYPRVSITYGSLYRADISDADVVFVYLLTGAYDRLITYLSSQHLKDDAVVIIEGWPLPQMTYYFKNDEKGLLPLYFYRGRDFHNVGG